MGVRNSARNWFALALALLLIVSAGADLRADRKDEYFQAARLALDPGRVEIQLDLTPGVAVAAATLKDIDGNRDGALSQPEQQAYANMVLTAVQVEVDRALVRLQLTGADFPQPAAIRRGKGTIRVRAEAALPRLSAGRHQLFFRNLHHPNRSAYLAHALAPGGKTVSIVSQRRDARQRELTVDFIVRDAGPARPR